MLSVYNATGRGHVGGLAGTFTRRRKRHGKTVRGIYENGEIQLLEDPQITGKQEVYIVFPDDEKPRVSGIPASDFQEIDGIVALGGDALEDSEDLWEEHLRAPDHY